MQFIKETHSKIESIFGLYKDSIRRFPYLLTQSEEIFFKSLCTFLKDEDYIVCPKVRVGDIIESPHFHWHKDNLLPGRPYQVSHRLDYSHIDFVLISKGNSFIKFAIELDDSSHDSPDRIEDDLVKDKAFKLADIPLLRFHSHFLTKQDLITRGILKN